MIRFTLMHPIKVNDLDFYAVIEKTGDKVYNISLYLGDKLVAGPKEVKSGSFRLLVNKIRQDMTEFFFNKLREHINT